MLQINIFGLALFHLQEYNSSEENRGDLFLIIPLSILFTIPAYFLGHIAFKYFLPSYISILLKNDTEIKIKAFSLFMTGKRDGFLVIWKSKYWNKFIERILLFGIIFFLLGGYIISALFQSELNIMETIIIIFMLFTLFFLPHNIHKTANEIIKDSKESTLNLPNS